MYSETLGGHCGFLGRDLGNYPPYTSVLDGGDEDDLLFLGKGAGEDDLLSRFLVGPALHVFHWAWKPFKVGVKHHSHEAPYHIHNRRSVE
jgi:hypothetical protein